MPARLKAAFAAVLMASVFSLAAGAQTAEAQTTSHAAGQTAPKPTTPRETALRILEMTQSTGLMEQTTSQFLAIEKPILVKAYPSLTPAQIDMVIGLFKEEMVKRMPEMQGAIADIYVKRFTPDELNGMLAFYESPVGQRLVEELPALSQESLVAGQALGRQIARDAGAKALERARSAGVPL